MLNTIETAARQIQTAAFTASATDMTTARTLQTAFNALDAAAWELNINGETTAAVTRYLATATAALKTVKNPVARRALKALAA